MGVGGVSLVARDVLTATGKASEARAMFAEAAAVRRTVLGPDDPRTKEAERGAR